MGDEQWRPLSVREADTATSYDALAENVPPYLHHSLEDWLRRNFLIGESGIAKSDALKLIELTLRTQLKWAQGLSAALESLRQRFWQDNGRHLLDAVDLALHVVEHDPAALKNLNGALTLGGSAWAVAPNGRALTRRVARPASDAARLAVSSGTRAAALLGDAWVQVYGKNPNPSEGYHLALRAAETAVCPVIIPADKSASLGKAIAALKDAPPGKYTTVFTELEYSHPLVSVRCLMELLWKQHIDRHGTADEDLPLSVSAAEAEAALFAAVTLVQWFERGVIRKSEP